MDTGELALQLLPPRCWDRQSREQLALAEEIRLRIGRPVTLLRSGREYPLPGASVSEGELLRVLEKATGASLHTAAPALAQGFVSYRGLRIGVCGTASVHEGVCRGFRSFSSLAIRIPRECRGVCDGVFEALRRSRGNILILSPPGGGKTTALRELIRLFSQSGLRVGVVDERWELAAAEAGRAGFELGPHSDVLSGFPKAQGAMMLLRGMNPQLIAMDEITRPEDLAAVRETVGCGVRLLATAHAAGPEDLRRRPLYRALLEEGLIGELVVIEVCGGERRYHWRRIEDEAFGLPGGAVRLPGDRPAAAPGGEAASAVPGRALPRPAGHA